MPNEILRWIVALAVLAHGVGHVLFMPVLAGVMRLPSSGHSWLLTSAVGDTPTRLVATLVAAVAIGAFVAAGAGLLTQVGWWRQAAVVGAAISIGLIVAMWDGIPTSSAFFAFVFDLLVLGALLIARWPTEQSMGA